MKPCPMIVEFLGTQGSGKTTLLPRVIEIFRDKRIEACTPVETARSYACRTVAGKVVGSLTPEPLRGKLLWQVYLLFSRLYRHKFAANNRELMELVSSSQRQRPDQIAIRERRILYWFFHLVGTYQFLTDHALPGEALVFDDGFVHRSVHLTASEIEPPDLSLVRSYLNLIPKPDLVIVPSVPLDVSLSRVVRRGVWKFFRDKSEDALKRYLKNSDLIVREAVSYMKSSEWNLIEVDNSKDISASTLELHRMFEKVL